MASCVENQRAISILAEEANKKRLVVFVGAGCSISAGLPSWQDLIVALLQKYNIKTNETNLMRLASRLEREVGALEFREQICNSLRIRPDIITSLHDKLVSLDANLFFTTNYDHILEEAFRKQGISPRVIINDHDLPSIDPTQKTIVKLHGDIDSPTSIIITSSDYSRFKTSHPRYCEWLNVIASQNTILFLGSSFDDPRLKEVDEHIFALFDKYRRQPFIVFKKPAQSSANQDLYEIELADFDALGDDFRDRGFFVIPIENYDEIQTILLEMKKKSLAIKIKESPADLESKLIFQSEHIGILERTLAGLLDAKTLELCREVRGDGRLPTPAEMMVRAEKLITYLENPPHTISLESQMEGLLTVIDSLLNSDKKDQVERSRNYFGKLHLIFSKIVDQEKWQERVLRVRAKLLFFSGKIDEAIESLSKSDDPKTISLWLAFLLDSGRLVDAYDYVLKHPVHNAWVCNALYALILSNQINSAEELFQETIKEFESLKTKGTLESSPFENEYFYEKLCSVMADALLRLATRLSGKEEKSYIFPSKLTEESRRLCQKALEYVDRLFLVFSRGELRTDYFAALAVFVEMNASFLLQICERADEAAKQLISVKPLKKEVTDYLLVRQETLPADIYEKVRLRLSEDHPYQSWAWTRIASIQAFILKDYEESWQTISKGVSLSHSGSPEEKIEAAMAAFGIGEFLQRLDETMVLIEETLSYEETWNKMFKAWYYCLRDDFKQADKLLTDIESQQPSSRLAGQVKYIRALMARKQENWQEARTFLQESERLYRNPAISRELLSVLTKLQDDAEALRVAEELETLGIVDWQVIGIKAQTARNLWQLQKSEAAWRRLVENFPERPDFALGLAEVLFRRDNSQEALRFLEKFIRCDNQSDPICLALAADILGTMERFEESFSLLNNCRAKIENDPSLLLRFLELGYKVDREKEANWALLRLELLRQEGKVPEEAFAKVPMEKVIEIINKFKEELEKLNEAYRLGKIPRLLICERRNMPPYLDWAVRTQAFPLPPDPKGWIDFTTYATNGMRVETTTEYGNQLVKIKAPPDSEEIVIDYHALITLHRLDLLKKIDKRYTKVFYPGILKTILAYDLKSFGHHQLSEEKVYRSLNDKLTFGKLREFVAPDLSIESEEQTDSLAKRNLRLARLESFPILDSYIEETELERFPEVVIIRLSQVVNWLYSKGKISESKFQELRSVTEGDREPITNFRNISFDDVARLLIDQTTLKIIEKFGIINLLLDAGIQVVVERATANEIYRAMREIDFGRNVGKWQSELLDLLRNMKVFEEVYPQSYAKERISPQHPYLDAVFSSLAYAEETGLSVLSDDRMMQMLRTPQISNRQFGTDALLADLLENEIITEEEYARCFLQLCQWRYRFLMPDVRLLLYLVKEHKQNPLGKSLYDIAEYSHQCMQDPGLFLGLEPTEPPTPLGVKLYKEWVFAWGDFLLHVWQDDDFSVENAHQITQKVFQQALPGPPRYLTDEVRKKCTTAIEAGIIKHLFVNASYCMEPLRLNGLFNQTFALLGYDELKREAELRAHLEFLLDFFSENGKEYGEEKTVLLEDYIIRSLIAFFGEEQPRISDPSIISILDNIGLNRQQPKVPDEYHYPLNQLPAIISSRDTFSERQPISEFVPKGPLIHVPPTEKKPGTIIIPDDLIKAPSSEVRMSIIKDILEGDFVYEGTKEFVRRKSEEISSGVNGVWHPAAIEVAEALLKDFKYARSLFVQAMRLPFPDEKLIAEGWKNVLSPDLGTILTDMPLLINGSLDKESIKQRISQGFIKTYGSETEKQANFWVSALDWYLENIYFVPVAPPLNPWRFLVDMLQDRTPDLKDKKFPSSSEILNIIEDWLYGKEDILAFVLALDIILNARGSATEKEKYIFDRVEFYNFLDKFFNIPLSVELRDLQEVDESLKKIKAAWTMRTLLASYYLKYIDLNDKWNIPEEKKVLLAWWLAREVTSSFLEVCKRFLSQHDQLIWIEEEVNENIKRQLDHIGCTHIFKDIKEKYSVFRYRTFYTYSLITSAIMSLLMPPKNHAFIKGSAFYGLKNPAAALSAEVRNVLIERLFTSIIFGEGEIPEDDESELSILWNVSLCRSTPRVIRAYYEDAIDFLGESKLNLIKFAEEVTQPEFIDAHLSNIPQYIEEEKEGLLAIITASLKNNILLSGKLPDALKVFEENRYIVKNINQPGDEKTTFCLVSLAQIINRLQYLGYLHWSKIISDQFQQLDYTKCSERTINYVVPELVSGVLLGADYNLLNPVLATKSLDKRVRKILGIIKERLQYAYPRIPVEYRETLRKILRDIKDIPVPEKRGLFED